MDAEKKERFEGRPGEPVMSRMDGWPGEPVTSRMDGWPGEPTTSRLEQTLRSVKDDASVQDYIRRYTPGNFRTFVEYFNAYAVEKGLEYPGIMKRSGISRNYFYNIVNGDRNPGRDKIIALCIAAGMNYDETNRALKIAKEGVLYPKDERDARIIIAINNRVTSVMEVNLVLDREGLMPIR